MMKNFKSYFLCLSFAACLWACNEKQVEAPLVQEPQEQEPVEEPGAPALTWRENWLEHELLLMRHSYNDSVVLYYDQDMDTKVTWPLRALTKIWNYTWKTYGGFGEDKRLKVALHGGTYSGGHPGYYLSNSHGNINMIDVGLSTEAWRDSLSGPLDILTHEVGHIVEGTSYNTLESPAFGIWGDSKWMEIYQYDVYLGLGWKDKAIDWHNRMMLVEDDFPQPGTQWYADWFYPIYENYGQSKVLNGFFKLLSEHFPTTSIPNGKKYVRGMNFGEFIHFWSGAAQTDLSELALRAFGSKDRYGLAWYPQLIKAREEFKNITY